MEWGLTANTSKTAVMGGYSKKAINSPMEIRRSPLSESIRILELCSPLVAQRKKAQTTLQQKAMRSYFSLKTWLI